MINGKEIRNQSASSLEQSIIKTPSYLNAVDVFTMICEEEPVHIPCVEELSIVSKHFKILNTNHESKLQNLFSFQKLLHFFDYVDSSVREEVYLLPSTDKRNESSRVIERGGKPDAMSVHGPMFLEIKGKGFSRGEGLIQGIERVAASFSCYSLFGKHLCFVRESSLSFLVYYKLDLEKNPQDSPIHIFQVNEDSFAQLFYMISSAISFQPCLLAHQCTYSLLHVLLQLQIAWWKCQILLLSSISSKVFQVIVGDGDRGKISQAPEALVERSFVVKLNFFEERFLLEQKALMKISKYYDEVLSEEHYSLASCLKNGLIQYFTTKSKHFLTSLSSIDSEDIIVQFQQLSSNSVVLPIDKHPSKKRLICIEDLPPFQQKNLVHYDDGKTIHQVITECYPELICFETEKSYPIIPGQKWFNYVGKLFSRFEEPETFQGIIVSRFGEELIDFNENFYHDVIDSIYNYQRCNIIHCDLRSCNILYFPYCNKHLVNDFDLSVCLEDGTDGENVAVSINSNQGKAAPRRIWNQLKNQKITTNISDSSSNDLVFWSKKDDLLMFTEYCMRKKLSIFL